jgi:hypothetical protein
LDRHAGNPDADRNTIPAGLITSDNPSFPKEVFMRKLIVGLSIAFLAMPLLAQQAAPKKAEDLQSLNWMVGRWEGESWIEFAPGQRRTSQSLETVQSKVGGAVMLIEGYHKGKTAEASDKAEDTVTHESISMLLYDSNAKRYRFVAYTARQGYGEFQVKVTGSRWEWEMPAPSGRVRFTITHPDKDEWSEKGESSQDGKSWHQFFGMTLHRTK